jgi:hypothetical protein
MPQREHPKPNPAGQPGEVFLKIDGIGQRYATRLWDAGIRTLEDLAKRTPEDLAEVTGRSVEVIASQNWTGQARELAGTPPEAPVPRQHYAAFHVEFLLESDNHVRRTTVRHHQTDTRDTWSGWDQERLLSFLRDRIPLPSAVAPADAPGLEPAHPSAPDQPPETVQPAPTSQPSPPAPELLPPGSLIIEELASIRDGQRSHIRSPGEPISVRLAMRINPTGTLSHSTFDFSVTFAAREFEGHDRPPLGTTEGAIRVGVPASVEMVGPALPVGLYRLAATVEIYAAGHSAEESPLLSQSASGGLMQVADAPLGSGDR